MRRLASLLAAATLCLTVAPLASANAQKVPKRPKLFAGADTNSWFAYYQLGIQSLDKRPEQADAAFYWAMRINPTAPEPMYASWVSFWRKQRPERFWDYMEGKRFVVESKDVVRIDSVRLHALQRNPMMFQGLWIKLLEADGPLPITLDPAEQGLIAYAHGDSRLAAARLGEALKNPQNRSLHYDRALALYQIAQFDSAANELELLLADMRKRDEKKLVRAYESKQMYEYAIGMTMAMKGDTAAAREAYGKALAEDLAFAPAHLQLAYLADAVADTNTAIQELTQAVELDSLDVAAQFSLGAHLIMKGKTEDAKVHLRKAIELEPYFAPPYFALAYILEFDENAAEAAKNYTAFADLAPEGDQRVAIARQKAAALAKAPAGGGQ